MVVTSRRTVVQWSGGRDSALALEAARADPDLDVEALVTTVRGDLDRVTMHGVRRELISAQADRLDLRLEVVEVPPDAKNAVYEERMTALWDRPSMAGVEVVVVGDIHLEDVRAYRKRLLEDAPAEGRWPLWSRDPHALARRFVREGHQAVLVCVDLDRLDRGFVGRSFDAALLEDLPEGVDPCGEHGEFHSFVVDGPGFSAPVHVEKDHVVERDGFAWQEISPVGDLETV